MFHDGTQVHDPLGQFHELRTKHRTDEHVRCGQQAIRADGLHGQQTVQVATDVV